RARRILVQQLAQFLQFPIGNFALWRQTRSSFQLCFEPIPLTGQAGNPRSTRHCAYRGGRLNDG
ncbi:hypothetical protein ACIPLR_21805, partial [Herbaspirillum huttiense]|uniref:hypothetical protein n=1 Tax=Herbaspirillum huttiense TaxID=863372 RepID=UPI0038267E28